MDTVSEPTNKEAVKTTVHESTSLTAMSINMPQNPKPSPVPAHAELFPDF